MPFESRRKAARTPSAPRSLIPALALLAGCSSAPGETVLTSHPQWEWARACCGFAGDERTPATEGYVYVLEFHPGGRVRAFRDDEPVIETGYRVTRSGAGPTSDESLTVHYDAPLPLGPGIEPAPGHLVVLLEDGSLLLRNLAPCADCYADWTFLPRLTQ